MEAGRDYADSYEDSEYVDPAPPSITISTTLERTAPIESYLREAGLERDEIREWSAPFKRASQNSLFQKGHPLTIYKDPESGEMRGLKYDLDDRMAVTEASLGAGIIKATVQPIQYITKPINLTFAVKDSFRRAAAENGIPAPIIESLEDAFADRHDLARLAPGAAVKLIYHEKVSRDGTYTQAQEVEAAQIRFGSRTLMAISFRDEHGRPHLYDEKGRVLGPQFLRFPVNFKYISSGFSFHRYHPVLHAFRPHVGVDLVAQLGEPVKAVADGKIESAGWAGELGNCVRIGHAHDMVSIYGHLSKISPGLKPDSYVHVGQVIGFVGSTGLSTGPHLHFAMEKRGEYVNPLNEKIGENHPVSPRMQALFNNIKGRYQSMLAKLPDLGSRDVSADSRKPAISKFGDLYHVSIKRLKNRRSSRSSARAEARRSVRNVSDVEFEGAL
ncbi:MAG: peptidoglycan DD-metalloendopeptidase family protein [Candidatus Binatus sp.]|uniref:M23 family metallopeptidase n=1 Tax=Candidatus Binatus sp. TaxID=2811406 RepID=UPI002722EDC4|nr:M23 family metallopeptidase [Candidatus Binatus sp.]MDO8431300.1 peptidoglycan DD-metalloendopeptidase family protein [Candidatus Binatus sp.]